MRPLVGLGAISGFSNEPALSMGDWVRQAMLAPPYAWRWNRITPYPTLSISTAGGQDYSTSITNFGWLEKAVISTTGVVKELFIRDSLAIDTTTSEPTAIAVQTDDNAGNIGFRIFPTPDQAYTVTLIAQSQAPLFTATTGTWTPIPDFLSYIYNTGFMAKAYEQKGDERFAYIMNNFFQMLNSHHAGQGETQQNLHLRNRMADYSGTQMKEPPQSVRYNIAERG
jgi:hypothetical protein